MMGGDERSWVTGLKDFKGLRELVQTLEANGKVHWEYEVDPGARRGVHTSIVMRDAVQDCERRFGPGNAVPLLMVAWADGTALTHRMSAHPVVFKVLNVNPELYHKRLNVFRAGATALMLGNKYWAKQHQAQQKALSDFVFHLSMDLIMEPFWDLNCSGFSSLDDGPIIVPYLVAVCADLDEAWQLACRPKNGTYCHLNLTISKDEYTNPNVRNLLLMMSLNLV